MTTWRTARTARRVWVVRLVIFLVVALGAGHAPAQERAPKPGSAAAGATRTWTDITGKFSREAEFLKLEDGQVHIRLKGGKETKIPLKELSKKDRDWVRSNAAAAVTAKPVGSRIVLRSYQAIVEDSVFLADALKQQLLAGAFPGLFVSLTNGKPLDGFDVTKPIVITVHVDEKGIPAGTLVAVPVQGKERFQKTLDVVFPRKTTPAGRGYEIAKLGKTVYAKPGEGYFLISDDANLVRNAAADPPPPVTVSDVAIETFNTAVSEDVRRAGLAQFDAFTAMIGAVTSGSEGARHFQNATQEGIRSMVQSLAIEAERSTVEASLDPTTKMMNVAVAVRARSGTPLAESFAAYGALRPRFVSAARDDAHGWVGVSVPTSAAGRSMIEGFVLPTAMEMVLGKSLTDLKQRVTEEIGQEGQVDKLAAITLLEEELDRLVAAVHLEEEMLFLTDEAGAPQVVTRITHDRARAIVAALGSVVAAGAAEGTVVPDGDGILSVPVAPGNPNPLLAQPIRVAATADTLFIAHGCADTDLIKSLLTAAPTSTNIPPISARLDLARLWPIVARANPSLASFADVVGGSGNVRADVNALTDGMELRVSADAGAMRLLGALGGAFPQIFGGWGAPGVPGAPPGFPPGGAPPAGLLPPSIQGFPVPSITPPGPPQPPAP